MNERLMPPLYVSVLETCVFPLVSTSPRQAGDGGDTRVLRESQLCPDPQRPGGSPCEPHKPDRLPLPPKALHRGGPWREAGAGRW